MASEILDNVGNAIAYALVTHFYEIKNYVDLNKQGVGFCDREYKDLVSACFVMANCEISKCDSGEPNIRVIKGKVFIDVYLQLSDMFSTVEELIDCVNRYTSLYEDDICLMDNRVFLEKIVEGWVYELPLNNGAAGKLVKGVLNHSKVLLAEVVEVLIVNQLIEQ